MVAARLLAGSVMPLHEVEKLTIIKGLEAMVGNCAHAAELLGIFVRTLCNKRNVYRSQGLPADA
ncbi:helix-turn-helix domain-containing protein [Candidatus Desulfovibrio trichonymphae]|uniref:helix-turn-helix domain-containing protein n=1 Tax=Candidatus Desulfovibrio trichonymphae TaxID=1725232 RepID=UPI000BBB3534|nr:hypothetical protein AGMMS49925_12400 [Deltaproteobacteria bacterium]GHU95071.1 hypothetical protein AGMMS49974_05740 [Deltaproteobacteria bacterium]GHU99056.1 hypothetical protein AGMMS50248_06590 [Deltaproteobacteria bacterium]